MEDTLSTYKEHKLDRTPHKRNGAIDVEEHFDDLTQLIHPFEELGYPSHAWLAPLRSQTILYCIDRVFNAFQAAGFELLSLLLRQTGLEFDESGLETLILEGLVQRLHDESKSDKTREQLV